MNDVNVNLSEQEQVRRAKLQKLVEEGKDPYVKTRFERFFRRYKEQL